jgi:phosphopantothenoylcysteine decarboxylase/phosphopantothenate--cysteine ligase
VQGKKGWLEKLDRICPSRNLWDNATMPSAMTSPSKARRRAPAVKAVLLPLQGKRILLGISGGVAAYKSALLARLLIKAGADVRVVLTAAGARFITAASLQALTGQPVSTDLWDARIPDSMGHISLSRDRDLILVAPASADFMAKVAQGHGDDLLSTICLARRCPLALAPAMNVEMWQRAPNQRNLALLQSDGVHLVGPDVGDQACGDNGMGRMLEAEALLQQVVQLLSASASQPLVSSRLLSGMTVLVTAGPTYEPIDPVRGITNRSSGKMGYAVAQAAAEAGAKVLLVSGPTALPTPVGVERIDVQTAEQMQRAVMQRVKSCQLFVAVAAVADYRVLSSSQQKIKREKGDLTLRLTPNPDILAQVAALKKPPFCIGFAAETEKLRQHAQSKRLRKGVPLLAANVAQQALGSDDNELLLFDDQGEHRLARAPKLELARALLLHAHRLMSNRRQASK